jgi:hypothetical protein
VSANDFGELMKKKVINVAATIGIAAALSLSTLGIGAGVANATPASPAVQAGWEQDHHGWGPGPWHPRPRYGYGYGGWGGDYGYGYGPPCWGGPWVHICR